MIKKTIPLFLLIVTLLVSCQPDPVTEEYTAAEKAKVEQLSFAKITDKKIILADDEPSDTVYSRSFNVRNVLSAVAKGDDGFKLVNYSPTTIKDVTIYAKLKNYSERIKLYTLDSIASFTEFKLKTPFLNSATPAYCITETGKWIEVSGMQNNNEILYSLDSPDPVFVKLKNLKTDWTVKLSITAGGNWGNMKPGFAREYVVFFCNMAYMFSQDDFKPRFDAYQGLIGNDKLPLTQEAKDKIYSDIINWKTFDTGIVINVSGLGGGSVLGISEEELLWQYTQSFGWAAFHELGHCLNYGHDSNMTYESSDGKAFHVLCTAYWSELLRTKQMPYWNYKLLNTMKKYYPDYPLKNPEY